MSSTRVSDGVCGCNIVNLQDCGFERGNRAKRTPCCQHLRVKGVDPIEPESEANHIAVAFGEMLNGCAVADMAKDMVGECILEFVSSGAKEFPLSCGECIEILAVRAYEMAEYRARYECFLRLKAFYETSDFR